MKKKRQITVGEQIAIFKLHMDMEERRRQGERWILANYLDRYARDLSRDEPDLRFEMYLAQHGINPQRDTFEQLAMLAEEDPVYKWLAYELLLSALHTALYADAEYTQLLAYSKPTQATVVTQPTIKTEGMTQSHKKGREVPQAAQFEEDTIEVGDKRVTVGDYGKTLKLPYHVFSDVTIDVLAEFLVDYVSVINLGKEDMIIQTAISGDGAKDSKGNDVDSSANEIGVKSTTNGITFYDIKLASMRMARLKKAADVLVGSEGKLLDISELEEFKKPFLGEPIQPLKVAGKKTIPENSYMTENTLLSGNKVMLLSAKNGVAEYVKQALMIEKEQLITMRQINIVFSERIVYMNRFRAGKCVLNGDIEFASNGFASYMTPTQPQ